MGIKGERALGQLEELDQISCCCAFGTFDLSAQTMTVTGSDTPVPVLM